MQQCLFCGYMVQLVHVHGHNQCPVCLTNALPCCDGDNCHTNQYLNNQVTEEELKNTKDPDHQWLSSNSELL